MKRKQLAEYDIRDVVDLHLVVKKAMELAELSNPAKERIVVVIYKEKVVHSENYK